MKTSNVKILIIENNLSKQKLLEKVINSSGIAKRSLFFANSLDEACNYLETKNNISIILLGLSIINHNIFKKIQQKAGNKPIIIIADTKDEKQALQFLKLGAQDYIVRKSLKKEILIKTITNSYERNLYFTKTSKKDCSEELKKLSLIAEKTVNAVIITDEKEKIQWVNEAFTRLTEYEPHEVYGKTPGEVLQGEETDKSTKKYMSNCITSHQSFECAVINYTKSGRKRWIKIQGQPIFDDTGKLKYYFAIETDVTEIRQAEEVLKSSEEKYRYLFNNNPACIFIWDPYSNQIMEVNETAIEQYCYTREEFVKLTILDLRLPEEKKEIAAALKEFSKYYASGMNKMPTADMHTCKHINKVGEIIYVTTSTDLINYKGRRAFFTQANNITDKVMLEQKLEEERLRKQHEITEAVISAQEKERNKIGTELHDNVNQILAGSRLYLSIIKKEQGKNHQLIEETDKLIYSAIQEIRSLSHSLVPPVLNESELIEAIDNIINIATKSGELVVTKDLSGFNKNAISDKMKLGIYRIVQEQFNNILKYAKAKSVKLKLKNKGNKVFLSIKDDGVGFDPSQKSTGLGLLNIKTRASLFKGDMKVISSPGKGCELIVNFA